MSSGDRVIIIISAGTVLRFVESKTRTYYGRVDSRHTAGRRGGIEQDWVPTELFDQEKSLSRTFQSIADTSPERLSRSTNKRNTM